MKLYFRTPKKTILLVKGLKDIEEAHPYMVDYLKEINFKSYYMRYWNDAQKKTIIDYGSYVNFFYFTEEDIELE
jgi:hypothetical protein